MRKLKRRLQVLTHLGPPWQHFGQVSLFSWDKRFNSDWEPRAMAASRAFRDAQTRRLTTTYSSCWLGRCRASSARPARVCGAVIPWGDAGRGRLPAGLHRDTREPFIPTAKLRKPQREASWPYLWVTLKTKAADSSFYSFQTLSPTL